MIKITGITEISLQVNQERRTLVVKPHDTLLDVLREQLGLTGPKAGCENGDCGACTVLLDGLPIKACLKLAVEVDGCEVMTVEGLKDTAIQSAFITEGGFQCGFCTAGFLVNAYALLEAKPQADDQEKIMWLEANLCRCTGYEGIKKAVDLAQVMVQKKHHHIEK